MRTTLLRSLSIPAVLAAVLLLGAGSARAQYGDDPNYYVAPPAPAPVETGAYTYGGIHPIPYEYGSGFCMIQGPHTHPYAPFDAYLFRQSNGVFHFVGDPADFGYAGPIYWFRGNHPIPYEYGGGYCFISWPHRHFYPPAGPYYRFSGGYYIYQGPWEPDYYQNRDYYWGYYHNYYRTYYYGNRYYSLRPAPIYRGTVVPAPAPGYRFGVRTYVPPPRGYAPAPAPGGIYRPGVVVSPPAPGYRPVPAPAPVVPAPAPTYRPAPYVPAPAVPAPAPTYRPGVPPPAPIYGGGGAVPPPRAPGYGGGAAPPPPPRGGGYAPPPAPAPGGGGGGAAPPPPRGGGGMGGAPPPPAPAPGGGGGTPPPPRRGGGGMGGAPPPGYGGGTATPPTHSGSGGRPIGPPH